jgi:hypothetical protein
MSKPTFPDRTSVRVVPLAIFALVLLTPLLSFDARITLYRSTLKLFVFQAAVTLLWCYLLWEWGAGQLRGGQGPAYWLFLPVALWAGWGLVTSAGSPQGWLSGGWLVQNFYGAAGALGLSLLLRDAAYRRVFISAGSAVAFALAFLMLVLYGDPQSSFLGEVDPLDERGAGAGFLLDGREVGAGFLLVPTLVAVAVLYERGRREAEADYRGVLWTTVLLGVLLLAGLRTGSAAWVFGLGIGVAAVAWLMFSRRGRGAPVLAAVVLAGAVALAVLVFLAAGARESVQQLAARVISASREERRAVREKAERNPSLAAIIRDPEARRNAVLREADWSLVGGQPFRRLLLGNGVGTYFLALDRDRPPETYAMSGGDDIVFHARRQLTEDLYERGLVGLALALAIVVACLGAGGMALRRARDGLDSALGAGLAAGIVAMTVFGWFSNGAVGFGTGMMFWVAIGLLGALSVECRRPAATSWSPEEETALAEAGRRGGARRSLGAMAGGLVAVAAWLVLGARPFWAEWCLKEAISERQALADLAAETGGPGKRLSLLERERAALPAALKAADEGLRAATAAHEDAVRRKDEGSKLRTLAAGKDQAAQLVNGLRQRQGAIGAEVAHAKEVLRSLEAVYREGAKEAVPRARAYLRRAASLSLGDRVWLASQLEVGRLTMTHGDLERALEVYERLDTCCGGPALDLDLLRARCEAKLGHAARAHEGYRRYASKNPVAASSASHSAREDIYGEWVALIRRQQPKEHPDWARDFIAAASYGLALLPRHYALLIWRGGLRWELAKTDEQKQAARQDIERADQIITGQLRYASPYVRAGLLLESASANFQWDKRSVVEAASRVLNMPDLDPSLPATQDLRRLAVTLLLEAGPELARQKALEGVEKKPSPPPKPQDKPKPPPGRTQN